MKSIRFSRKGLWRNLEVGEWPDRDMLLKWWKNKDEWDNLHLVGLKFGGEN